MIFLVAKIVSSFLWIIFHYGHFSYCADNWNVDFSGNIILLDAECFIEYIITINYFRKDMLKS